jgi:hypothetical protein
MVYLVAEYKFQLRYNQVPEGLSVLHKQPNDNVEIHKDMQRWGKVSL